MRVLVCGGAGYIGSHACVELAARGHHAVVFDSFVNASRAVPARVRRITGRPLPVREGDLRQPGAVASVLAAGRFDAVLHFAALKSVGASCRAPLDYFDNNISGTLQLLRAMRDAGVPRLVFSSSATVYGDPDRVPVDEDAPLRVTNPYGRTKLVMEAMIADVCASDPGFHAVNLRYFNPVGAHPSGLIGEDPAGVPDNLMPYICQAAVGRRARVEVFGGDWPTVDGTGVRDYLHVVDLARAHVDALDFLHREKRGATVNLGTGRGTSVLQLLHAFARASGRRVPHAIVARRAGDVAEVYADVRRARALLGWTARLGVDDMCRDAWRWQSRNPDGYATRAVPAVPAARRPAAAPSASLTS